MLCRRITHPINITRGQACGPWLRQNVDELSLERRGSP